MSRSFFPTFIIIVVPHPEYKYFLLEIVSKFYFTANYCSKLTVNLNPVIYNHILYQMDKTKKGVFTSTASTLTQLIAFSGQLQTTLAPCLNVICWQQQVDMVITLRLRTTFTVKNNTNNTKVPSTEEVLIQGSFNIRNIALLKGRENRKGNQMIFT